MKKSIRQAQLNQGIAPIAAIIIGLIFGAVIVVGIVVTQKKAPVSDEPLFVPVEETLMEEVTEEEIIFQKSHEWGGFTFNYPSNWELTENMYTTPAGFTDVVGLSIKPIDQVSQNDYISVGGRQASCSVFPASQGYICNEMNFPPVYTQSTNPIILDFYSKLIQDLQKQTTQTACLPSDPPSITVTNPKAGDIYTVGQQVTIEWTSCNVQDVYLNWGIGGKSFGLFSETPTPVVQGFYQWTAPSPIQNMYSGYWIGIESQSPNITAKSGVFNITPTQKSSSCFVWPQAGATLPYGSTQTIELINPPQYNSHCGNGFSLIDPITNEVVGYPLGLLTEKGKTSYTWTVNDSGVQFTCGTSADEFPAYFYPGQYKLRFYEYDTAYGTGSNSCDSDVFTLQ